VFAVLGKIINLKLRSSLDITNLTLDRGLLWILCCLCCWSTETVIQMLLQQLKFCEDKQKNGHVSVIFKDRHKQLLGSFSSALMN
jgi:hypothetical protein